MDDIREFIIRSYLPEGEALLDEQTPLFVDGVLDSIHLVSLVIFLRDHFQVQIHPLEITPENFKNLHTIHELVQKKLALQA